MDPATSDADPEEPSEIPVPRAAGLLGLLLAGCAALPLTPDGQSFLDLVGEALAGGLLPGLLMLTGFGSPFWFGLAVGVGVLFAAPPLARRFVRVPMTLMHSQLLLVAIVVWREGEAVGGFGLLGFSVVSGIHLAVHTARTSATGDGPQLGWSVRWGAMVIAAIAAWARLQRLADVRLGWGFDAILVVALLMVAVLGRRPLGGAAPLPR